MQQNQDFSLLAELHATSAGLKALADSSGAERGKLRIDQWLWFARFAKSRSLAGRLCDVATAAAALFVYWDAQLRTYLQLAPPAEALAGLDALGREVDAESAFGAAELPPGEPCGRAAGRDLPG